MDLAAIRQGLADALAELPGVSTFDQIPDTLPVGRNDCLVIQPDDGDYVRYSAVNGMTSQNQVFMVVTIITQSTDWGTAQRRIDELLSCGSDQPRSIRTKLASNISANGTACQVIPVSASVAKVSVGGQEHWGADFRLEIQARC